MIANLKILAACLAAVLTGCASYDGRGLVPGTSTAAQVEALMGKPAERIAQPGGGSVWFYPQAPLGRHTYAVQLGPDGVVRTVEQRLTRANVGKLIAGTSTQKQVRELFGPPYSVARLSRQGRQVWEYKLLDYEEVRVLWVQFSDDGVVREVLEGHDWTADPPIGPSRD